MRNRALSAALPNIRSPAVRRGNGPPDGGAVCLSAPSPRLLRGCRPIARAVWIASLVWPLRPILRLFRPDGKSPVKAWRINELGHPSTALTFEDVPDPVPGPGEARVRVLASTINFADILLCQGIYQDRPGVPLTPGLETFGVVEAVGDGVDLALGTRVGSMAALPSGGFAEKALIRCPAALVFPEDVTPAHATVLHSTYQTSHVGLFHRGSLQAGEWILIHAGAGGVGSAAVQLARNAGARVIATAGSEAKTARCEVLGAHHAINYRTSDLYAEVMRITDGYGVDVVYDPVGGAVVEPSRRLLAFEGRYLVIGFAGGGIPSFPGNHVLVKNYAVVGVHWGYYGLKDRRPIDAAHADLLRMYRAGDIAPLVTEAVPLSGIPSVLERLEGRAIEGRAVLVTDE